MLVLARHKMQAAPWLSGWMGVGWTGGGWGEGRGGQAGPGCGPSIKANTLWLCTCTHQTLLWESHPKLADCRIIVWLRRVSQHFQVLLVELVYLPCDWQAFVVHATKEKTSGWCVTSSPFLSYRRPTLKLPWCHYLSITRTLSHHKKKQHMQHEN